MFYVRDISNPEEEFDSHNSNSSIALSQTNSHNDNDESDPSFDIPNNSMYEPDSESAYRNLLEEIDAADDVDSPTSNFAALMIVIIHETAHVLLRMVQEGKLDIFQTTSSISEERVIHSGYFIEDKLFDQVLDNMGYKAIKIILKVKNWNLKPITSQTNFKKCQERDKDCKSKTIKILRNFCNNVITDRKCTI
jgi:hypothetical protein